MKLTDINVGFAEGGLRLTIALHLDLISVFCVTDSLQDMSLWFFLFIFFRFHFIFKERGREGEGEGEKYQMAASHMPPTWDLTHNSCMCPTQEWTQQPFRFQADVQSTELHQPGPMILYITVVIYPFLCPFIHLSSYAITNLPFVIYTHPSYILKGHFTHSGAPSAVSFRTLKWISSNLSDFNTFHYWRVP